MKNNIQEALEQRPIILQDLFRAVRMETVDDKVNRVIIQRDPANDYSLPWLVIYNAEQHLDRAKQEEPSRSMFNSAWQRKIWGSAAKALLFPGFKQKQITRKPKPVERELTKSEIMYNRAIQNNEPMMIITKDKL